MSAPRIAQNFRAASNSGGAVSGIENAETGNIHQLTTEFLTQIFPRKTWSALCDLLGITERVAKHRLAGTRAYSLEDMQRILRSRYGGSYLRTLMRGSREEWWGALSEQHEIALLRAQQSDSEKKLRALEEKAASRVFE